MTRNYSHDVTGARAIAGQFELEREERLELEGREVLYLLGTAMVDTSCCGVTGLRYVVVPGFVVSWRSGRSAAGAVTSEVEPVQSLSLRRSVERAIRARETVSQVVFW